MRYATWWRASWPTRWYRSRRYIGAAKSSATPNTVSAQQPTSETATPVGQVTAAGAPHRDYFRIADDTPRTASLPGLIATSQRLLEV